MCIRLHNGGMEKTVEEVRREAWSDYWGSGALHSCVTSYQDNYTGAIAEFWKRSVKGLHAGSRVLDLATGNGALPLLLSKWTSGIRVDAVDLAELAPGSNRPAPTLDITFHAGVAMEQLPFADATFDMVVSQFGIEYARWPEAVVEATRVGTSPGRVAFLLHHADSVLVKVGRAELHAQEILLQEGGLFDVARDVMPLIAMVRRHAPDVRDEATALATKARYNDAMTRVSLAIRDSIAPDLLVETRAWIHGLLAGITREGADRELEVLDARRRALVFGAVRTSALVDHALDSEGIQRLLDFLRVARPLHQVSCEPIVQREGILGWGVTVRPDT